MQARAVAQKLADQAGAGLGHVLAVVEDEQEVLFGQVSRQGGQGCLAGLRRQVHDLQADLGDERRVGEGRQLDQEDPVGEPFQDLAGHLEGQAGLAGAA